MKLNKLLERQLGKFLPEAFREREELKQFINAVNDTYNAYERDNELSERAFRMSEEEYRALNNQLKQEITLKKASIDKLKEVISEPGETDMTATGNDDQELLHIVSYLEKRIADQKEAEKKLHDQKVFYEQILNHIPADIAITDKDHRYLFINPSAIKNPEVRQWIIGKNDVEYAAYRNRPLADILERRKHFDEAIATRQQKIWEERIVKPDGKIEYQLRMLFPVFDDNGEMDIMIIYGVNITERKKSEELLKQSEAKFRQIFDYSQALICTHDLSGRVLAVNHASTETLGYKEEELTGSFLYSLLPKERQQEFEQVYMNEIRTRGKAEGIMVALNRTGRKIYLLYQNYLVTDDTEQPYVIGFSQDITGRIEAERALKKSEEKYRNIIANMNLGLVEVDPEEYVVYANNSFCEMSGYSIDELIGEHAPTVLLKGAHYSSKEIAERRQNGQSDAYELMVRNKQGEKRWWLVSGAPVLDDNGAFKGSIGIHLDITLQKTLEQELRKAKADAEHSAHAKEVFLANMSHEIRTPMNAILGIARLLAKTEMDPQQEFYLDTIQNAANNLLVLINDLLDLSKIEAGRIDLERIGFNLEQTVSGTVQMLRHKAEEKGLGISYEIAADTAPVFIGDPYRINQVLMNLLSNALKFTERGAVQIACSVQADRPDSQEVLFRVNDTGIGIGEDFIQHLFDKFTQEDETVTRKFGGTGLGMSICKQLVELMGGTIQVESRKNEGTTIYFTLQLPKGTAADLPVRRNQKADTRILKGKRILLVEDNPINRLVARTVLKLYGAEVTEAPDGIMAIDLFEKNIFDLVLMDVQMPGKDGLETTRYIRSHMDSSIPIIALTANAFKEEEERCMQAGMNDFISKPFDEEQMIQLIARWLGSQ